MSRNDKTTCLVWGNNIVVKNRNIKFKSMVSGGINIMSSENDETLGL